MRKLDTRRLVQRRGPLSFMKLACWGHRVNPDILGMDVDEEMI